MDVELKSLEDKINQFVALCQRLRAENHELRQQLVTAQNENKLLNGKIGDAKTRLETLLTQIPEEQT
jgi:cell division protein ZapB